MDSHTGLFELTGVLLCRMLLGRPFLRLLLLGEVLVGNSELGQFVLESRLEYLES